MYALFLCISHFLKLLFFSDNTLFSYDIQLKKYTQMPILSFLMFLSVITIAGSSMGMLLFTSSSLSWVIFSFFFMYLITSNYMQAILW